eukprot:scaffold10864_cov205-Cylindrotheca_fusiformis.AAC.1
MKRRRRLGESSITNEQAEAACAPIEDALDRKDCVYDVLVTQDLTMVGAVLAQVDVHDSLLVDFQASCDNAVDPQRTC